ncbi:hypothetical protein GF249_11975 [Salmonella enterica subsp. enterica]|nr:hypothetical protein [Salmonella enterica subsp. enterica serovar Baildon]
MKRLFRGILVMLLMAGCFPFMAQGKGLADSKCDVSGGMLPLKNINLKLSEVTENKVLYTSQNYPLNYRCVIYPAFGYQYAPTLTFSDNFVQVIRRLKEGGLGINLIIKESGQGDVRIPWSEIKSATDRHYRKRFGAGMSDSLQDLPDAGSGYNRSATVRVELFVETAFVQNRVLVINTPAMPSFIIMPIDDGNGKPGTPLQTGPFSIRFLPDALGKVIVSPSRVKLGHFYTTIPSSLSREQTFTVTAQQQTGSTTSFSVPLKIDFQPQNGLTVIDGKYLQLANQDGANGLRLALRNESGSLVTFNTPENMGTINIGGASSPGSLSGKWTAVVDRIPGAEVKTGEFSASISVVVTYN